MSGSGRWLSSLLFLALGLYAGAKLGSGAPPSLDQIPNRSDDVATAPEASSRPVRGPASVSGTAGAVAVDSEEELVSPHEFREQLTKPENFTQMQAMAAVSKMNWMREYVWKHFNAPNDYFRNDGYGLAYETKLGEAKVLEIQKTAKHWKATATATVEGQPVSVSLTYEDIPGLMAGEDPLVMANIEVTILAGRNPERSLNAQTNFLNERDGKFYQAFETVDMPDLGDIVAYFMVPLPQQDGKLYFLGAKSFKWTSSQELIWEPVLEQDPQAQYEE